MTVGDKITWLRKQLSDVSKYPVRADCVGFGDKPVSPARMSFFPGGLGIYDCDREGISTIVLGSDWGTKDDFDEQLRLGKVPVAERRLKKEPAVTRAGKILHAAGWTTLSIAKNFVVATDVFYTNAWPVMRKAAPPSGYHAMRDDETLTKAYREYLRLCICELKPKVIVTLGVPPAWFVGPLIGGAWILSGEQSSKKRPCTMMQPVPIQSDGVVYVAITHPSYPNAKRRGQRIMADGSSHEWSYADEVCLLTEARKMAGIAAAET